MALIEGVGDEVTVLCALLFLLLVIGLAWISTHTSERGSAPWSSQAFEGQPVPGSNDAVPVDTTSTIRQNNETSCVSPDASHVLGDERIAGACSDHEPSSGSSHNSQSPTVRHRGPQTQGDSSGSQDTITLRLKFLNETERVLNVRLTDSVLHIKRSQFPGEEPRVRLIYQGQILRDDSQTVASLQLTDGCVLHCHLSQHASASGSEGTDPSQDSVNIGSLMVPLFLLLLGILWYCQFQYPHVFNGTATACLGAMTLFVLVLVFSSYRR